MLYGQVSKKNQRTERRSMETTSQPHPVDEMLPPGKLLAYGLRHVLAMYAGAVAVPLMVAHGLGLTKAQLIGQSAI